MNIEQLEKLNELKEKGLLTQEEVDKQKKALLTPEAANKAPVKNKKGASWKNLGKSFIITVLWCFAIGLIAYMLSFVVDDSNIKAPRPTILWLLSATGLAMIASELETKKYKHYFSAFGIFFFSVFLGPLGVWIAFYQFLQIKQGNAILEGVKKMNETDLNTISKLKELRDKNAITQEEFDEQVAIYLNSDDKKKIAKSTEKKKTQNILTIVLILGIGIGLYGQTIVDELYLYKSSKICKKLEDPEACDCIKIRTVKKLPFTYKLETVLGVRDGKTIPGEYVDIIDVTMCSMHMM